MAALQRYLEKDEISERRHCLEDLFKQYFGDSIFYHTASIDEIMSSFNQYPIEERLSRMEMLAELYYAEADMLSEPTRTQQLNKAFMLFDFIDRNGKTFSFERTQKMSNIQNAIKTNPK